MDKLHMFSQITEEMYNLYERKNKDYGDSFAQTFDKYGPMATCLRIEDKMSRFHQLAVNGSEQEVLDESVEDSLIDAANYAIMTVIELRRKRQESAQAYKGRCEAIDMFLKD